MDPEGVAMISDGGREYGYAEMWPGFQVNYNAASSNVSLDQMAIGHELIQRAPGHGSVKQRGEHERCAKEGASTSNSNGGVNNSSSTVFNHGDSKLKAVESLKIGESENGGEGNSGKVSGKAFKPAEPPKDYIHVRARRGQATDSHSLAERARREKISERMKILQNLVPGCNKVIGKALVLDEIINYIQTLQRQVEFLSMKLEAVNSRLGIEQCQTKEFPQHPFLAPTIGFGSQNSRAYAPDSASPSPEWLHMQIGGGFERTP